MMPQNNIPPGMQFGMGMVRNNPISQGYNPAGPGNLQTNIDRIQQALMMAQIYGAPPQKIAALQMELQKAQRAYQEAGAGAMAEMQKQRPQFSPSLSSRNSAHPGGGGHGGLSPSQQATQQNYDANMQLLMSLWGMGGGRGGGISG